MKRGMAFLLAAALVVMCVPALAVSYTVDEKFWGQAGNMAVKGTVTFSVTGNETAAMDAETFQLLKSTLPGSIITFSYSNYPRVGRGGQAVVETGDGAEKKLTYLVEEDKLALGGDMVSGDGTFYLLETDAVQLLSLFRQEESTLPGLADMMQLFEQADEQWQTAAQERLALYETRLSMWMNDYTGTAMGQDGDMLYSELNCTLPAQAVKDEIGELLSAFYRDTETLALLQEVLGGTDAEMYLNPAMESVFADLVQALPLEGDITVIRRFDSRGQLVLDGIEMPLPPLGEWASLGQGFGKNAPSGLLPLDKWQRGSLTVKGDGGLAVTLENDRAEQFAFSAQADGTNAYQGKLVMDALNAQGGMDHVGYDFVYAWQAMDETYSLQTDICERLMQGTVTLTPDEQTAGPAQRITLDLRYTTTSDERTVSYLEAALVWMDLETETSLALSCNMETAFYFDAGAMADLENVVMVKEMPMEERKALLDAILLAPLNQAVTLPEL